MFIRSYVYNLAIIDKYGVLIRQWAYLYQALSLVSMNKISLPIIVFADDWTAERVTIVSNEIVHHYIIDDLSYVSVVSVTSGCSLITQ